MKAIFVMLDGMQVLKDIDYDQEVYQQAIYPSMSMTQFTLDPTETIKFYQRTYRRVDVLRGHSGECAIYHEVES